MRVAPAVLSRFGIGRNEGLCPLRVRVDPLGRRAKPDNLDISGMELTEDHPVPIVPALEIKMIERR